MVRETRHLWVGNLPENIREDRIREHFKRYGRVQSVKIFSRKGGGECDGNGLVGCGTTGICATVSFMDIKSASKAHNNEHKLDEHSLTTEYHEPVPIPAAPPAAVPPSVSAGGSPVTPATPTSLRHPPPYSSPRFTHGPTEDITTFDRSSHFYERRDGAENYVRRPPSAYHVVSPSESLRGRTRDRDRLYRNGPPHYTPILESVVARTPPTHHRTVTTTGWSSFESSSCSRYPSSVVTTPEILSYQEERRESTPVIIVHKKHPKSRRKCRVMPRCGSNGSESVSNNSDSSRSRSHSSSSSSHSRSSSSSSDSSSAAISERSCSTHSHHGSLKSTVTVHSTISTPLTNCSPVVHTDDRRPLAICVRNLPARSSDSSLKDGLYHEYKKHGKVTSVKILGQGANRNAIVCFKKADDVDKAMQMSHDKLFFGSKIEVTIYHGFDVEDNDIRSTEADLDEYHPKATRTLFIGNLEKDITVSDLRNIFQKFGEIIDIDIRKQGTTTCFAFCQYCDISSVIKAMHAMDGEYLGNNKINLGYGKSLATNCLWVAGVADCVTEKQLSGSFSQFGHVTHVVINRSQGKALVFFQQTTHAQAALSQMRGYNLKNRRLMADYASPECQQNFYEHYEKSKSVAPAYENNCQDSPRSTGSTRGLDTPVSSTSSNSGNISKHSMSSITNSNNSTSSTNNNNNNNINNNNSSSNSSNKISSRLQHTVCTTRTTPTHLPVPNTPSSNSASPIVNNTPSPSPSTSSRSTPRPQQTSRFDYTNTLECSSDQRISRSFEDLNINNENDENHESSIKSPRNPQDDVTLQKERVSLLEQLNDYSSSEEDDEEDELTSMKQQNVLRQQRSTSREESRPGTPLCDERPENILAHYESRRAAKEKNTNNTPLSLPLPSFANKVPRSVSPTERFAKSPHLTKSQSSRSIDGGRNSSLTYTRQSPSSHIKDKPSILDSKLSSITSFDSLTETSKVSWIEQLKSLDEKYEKWSGSRSKVLTGKLDTSAVQTKHKLLDVNSIGRQRSEICQTVLSRKSVFDDHFKRLETITDQPPSTDFVSPRVSVNNSTRSHSLISIATAALPNLCTKPISTMNSASSSSSASLSPSPSAIKGLQYPFPSHPPIKSTLPKVGSSFALAKTFPDPLQSSTTLVHASNPRTSLLLRNNSVEKLTDLPKSTSPSTSREPQNRLDTTSTETRKELSSPVGSRRNSVESVGRKSVDEQFTGKENKKLPDTKVPIVNHVEAKPKFNNAVELCKTAAAEKENSVLDKRKTPLDKNQSENSNAVSVIFHTSQRDKQNTSLEDVSEAGKISRRSSMESNSEDDRLRVEERSKVHDKESTDVVNHTNVKINDTRPDLNKVQKSSELKRDKSSKSEFTYDESESTSIKTVPCHHVDDVKDLEKKKDDLRKSKETKIDDLEEKGIQSENNEPKCGIVDEDYDDDDSNDVDDNKTITVKNKIIETVFHIKHEKKKQYDSKAESLDDKSKSQERKKVPSEASNKPKESETRKDSPCNDAKSKKECIKTKEFNMFENKPMDKKKNHFLSESRKSVESDAKDDAQKNSKPKEIKEKENLEQCSEKTKIEKKKEKHNDVKCSKDVDKRKSEEKRDEPKPIPIELEKQKPEEKYAEKKYEPHKSEQRKEVFKPKEPEKDTIAKEKKKEKISGQPENGKIKLLEYKKCKEPQENHKPKPVTVDKEIKVENPECEKSVESKTPLFHKNKFTQDMLKSFDRQDTSKERKNSSGSSSLSDSVHSKSKLSSFDSTESNNEDKVRHDSLDNDSHILKKFDKHKNNNSAAENNSGREERRSDSSRNKKMEKTGTSCSKRKKSKKRKTLSGTSSDSEFESYDENKMNKKNHSIFDVVLDEPAYISMYDKVKARSTKNLQKQEEEKRQEKLKEKFNQLKQSRVKREEKKRSTSYDDDSDPDRTIPRKSNKLILDSSDEENSGTDKVKVRVPSDSSDDERQKKKLNSDGESDNKIKYRKTARRLLNPKSKEKSKHTLTDTSEDELKLKQKREQQFVLNSENNRKFKKGIPKKMSKRPSSRHKRDQKKKTESDLSDDENQNKDKPKSYFEKRKMDTRKIYSDFSDDNVKTKPNEIIVNEKKFKKHENDMVNDGFVKRTKPRNDLKAMIEKGELNLMNNFQVDDDKSRIKSMISDISEEEELKPSLDEKPKIEKSSFVDDNREKFEKLLSDTSENESITFKRFPQKKKCNIYSEDSELDVTIKQEEKNDELFFNLAELHHDFEKSENSSPPPLIDPMVYDVNDFQKKKSHKKKQKRQKSREHSIDRNKKHSKKERRKSIPSDAGDEECREKDHKIKQKKKKKNRNKIKNIENLEEDIFGSMSDDSDKLHDASKLSKLSVSDVYDADSDSSNKDVRENESNSIDESTFLKTNNEVESKLFNSVEKNYDYFDHIKTKKKKRKKSKDEKSSKHHHHHHHHHHNHHHTKHDPPAEKTDIPPPPLSLPCLVESNSVSSSEKSNNFEFEESKETPAKDDEATVPPKDRKTHQEAVDIVTSSIAESINEESQEIKIDTDVKNIEEVAVGSISNTSEENVTENIHERAVKSIASDVHENIHEQAVLSIANALIEPVVDVSDTTIRPVEEKLKTNAVVDDKTGITISQEETEDAVAAILGESTEFGFTDCYPDDAMKPDTPNSEPELQIDTDAEDTSTLPNKDKSDDVLDEMHSMLSGDESFLSATDEKVSNLIDEITHLKPDTPVKVTPADEEIGACTNDSTFHTCDDRGSEAESTLTDSEIKEEKLETANESIRTNRDDAPTDVSIPENESFSSPVAKTEDIKKNEKEELALIERSPPRVIVNIRHDSKEHSDTAEEEVTPNIPVDVPSEHRVELPSDTSSLEPKEVAADAHKDIVEAEMKVEKSDEKLGELQADCLKPQSTDIGNTDIEKKDAQPKVADKFVFNNYVKSPDVSNPLKSEYKSPNNLAQHLDLMKCDDKLQPFPFVKSIISYERPKNNFITSEVTNLNDTKKNNRKRSYVECNGPTLLNIQEQEKIRIKNDVLTSVYKVENFVDTAFYKPKENFSPVTPITPIELKNFDEHPPLVQTSDANNTMSCVEKVPSVSCSKTEACDLPEKVPETTVDSKVSTVTDHTYNSIGKKQQATPIEAAENTKTAKDNDQETVILERAVEQGSSELPEKDEPLKSATFEDATKASCNSDKIDRVESDATLKQKLQIPAQQNTEITDSKELERDSTEVNEANKENIVKTILNQDNITEVNDDTKLNVIVKNKEITRTVEDEIFKGVANDFSKCNHKMPENNRNMLEKVVQRIHESKRIIQKSSEEFVPIANANMTSLNVNEKVALATEDEIKSAEILLKMSESSIIKSQVTDYNCIMKVGPEHEMTDTDKLELKIEDKDSSFELGKNDSFSSADLHHESNEEVPEMTDESHAANITGTKLADHSHNAKRGRRRKAAAPGGVVTRRGKQNCTSKEPEIVTNFKLKKSSADVYEFKEDSEDEVKRPRLILTIKGPIEHPTPPPAPAQPSTALPAIAMCETPVITESKSTTTVISNPITTPVTPKSASAYTRKSRRLQEKEGGPRNTVDDTIDEVIKTVQSPRPTRRTTRIAAAAAAAIITTVHESTRKNSRGAKKTPVKSEVTLPSTAETQPAAVTEEEDDDFPPSPATSLPSTSPSTVIPSSPVSARVSTEPTNLIDPVTGLLIPMKEAEEGQSQKVSDCPPEKKARLDESVEESAISLVKSESTPKVIPVTDTTITTSVIASTVTTSVIASAPVVPTIKTTPPRQTALTTTLEVTVPTTHIVRPNATIEEDGPISLIKTTTASIITPVAAMKSHTAHSVPYNQSYPSMVYSQSQPAKLHTSKTIIPQPRVLTPITPKAHIMQALNSENDNHSNDEVPYPPQYSSPLLPGAVASPPLASPKISPQPVITGANNTRVAHAMKNMRPLEPLKIDQTPGYYYIQNTSPQSRPALAVQSPSPQPRVVHTAPSLSANLLPQSTVQSAHYIHQPQFMYQPPYIQEPSITPYHHIPPQSSSSTTGGAKIITDRDIIENRPPTTALVVAPSPPLELRKRSSPRPRVGDSPLITSPYVQNNRAFYYDEPLQPHRPLQNRLRVSTPPYASKVPSQGDPVDMFVPTQSRLHLDAPRFTGHVPPHDESEETVRKPRTYTDVSYVGIPPVDGRISSEGELDYSRRNQIALCDGAVPRSRGSPLSQMDSPPLGDSPPQGNLDGTVLVQMYPIIWQGLLALKNDQAAVQMHVVSGNRSVAYDALPKLQDGYQPLLRIAQRMRLEQAQLDGVNRKMEIKDEHCTILGLPCGKNQEDVLQQATNLESCIIPYLQQKKAAGIINTAAPGTQQAAFVVHVFPPCEFADNVLLNAAPDLYRRVHETAYLVCIIVTV